MNRDPLPEADVARQALVLYLDLLERALRFALWPEPPAPVDLRSSQRSRLRRVLARVIDATLRPRSLQLSRVNLVSQTDRDEGRCHWPQQAHTMIGARRLRHLRECVETLLAERVPGDLLEAGVWRGGASILMRGVLAAHGIRDRRVWLADSFRGLPPPDPERYPADAGDLHSEFPQLAVSRAEVEEHFRRYGLLDSQVVFLEGWFADTLPSAPVDRLALLRVDGDMYGSTIEVFEHLYVRLAPGGFCIVDDYALPGCRRAVDDFRRTRGITVPLRHIDWTGVSWRL